MLLKALHVFHLSAFALVEVVERKSPLIFIMFTERYHNMILTINPGTDLLEGLNLLYPNVLIEICPNTNPDADEANSQKVILELTDRKVLVFKLNATRPCPEASVQARALRQTLPTSCPALPPPRADE